MAMPHFVGIGAQKAGTTWLYDMLAQNPSVWLPPLKEVHFFDVFKASPERLEKRARHIESVARRLEVGKQKGSDGDGAAKVALLRSLIGRDMQTAEWYGSIFDYPDAKGRVTGEITPAYLELDDEEMEHLAGMLPEAKFVLVIREPQARAMSQLKMVVDRSKTGIGGRRDWSFYLKRIQTNTRGNYQTAIPRWQKFIPADRLLILPFSLVREDPAGLLRQVEDFIGAERFDGYKAMTEQIHKTKEVPVPDWVVDEVAAFAAPQKAYLIDAFGEEFYNKTR